MAPISNFADLRDSPTGQNSNTKVMTFIVVTVQLGLWGALKFLGKELTWIDAFFLVSLVTASHSVRALLALWKIRRNGNGNGKVEE